MFAMSSRRGTIALMGSGEFTSTMVEVHKELLAGLHEGAQAVFVDTPAGFQLNADELSRRATTYFERRVGHPLQVVSWKSKCGLNPLEAELACQTLRRSDYVLIGPGSPTYAVKQWLGTPIPGLLLDMIRRGGCLVAASAAAITVGSHTLPVYEIYKVGEDLHWAPGLEILKHFGFDLVVIPHWNNAEGGTHDTRYCYMGGPRFERLESLLPEGCGVLGLEEHTACLLDFSRGEAAVRGIGCVVVRHGGLEQTYASGERFPLEVLRGESAGSNACGRPPCAGTEPESTMREKPGFWDKFQEAEALFRSGLDPVEPHRIVSGLLEADLILWGAQGDLENPEFLTQGRERFREMLIRVGTLLGSLPRSRAECLTPVVESLLEARERYRRASRWQEADVVRDLMAAAGIVVEDTGAGPRWRLK